MNFFDNYFQYEENKEVCGLTKELNNIYIFNYYKSHNENILVLTSSLYEANNVYKSLSSYIDNVLLFPMDDFLTSVAVAISPDFKVKRLETIDYIKNNPSKKHIIITCLTGYLRFLPNKNEKTTINIKKDDKNISREIILSLLDKFGYKKETLVTTTGEYAVRGFIIDIFPANRFKPIRIEFFDDNIENIKEFDENTQLSIKNIKEVEIGLFTDIPNEKTSSIVDYLNNQTIFMINKKQIETQYKLLVEQMFEYNNKKNISIKHMYEFNEIKYTKLFLLNNLNDYKTENTLNYESKELENFNFDIEKLKDFCAKSKTKKGIIFVVNNNNQVNQLKKIFPDIIETKDKQPKKNKITYMIDILNKGFYIDDFIFISPFDIDKSVSHEIKYKNKIKTGKKIKFLSDLQVGDFIVHESYGIGIYNGLKTLKQNNIEKDFIQLLYFNNDKIYLPVSKIGDLYKYGSKDEVNPKLDKLNSNTWLKRKQKVQKEVTDLSEKLLSLYSLRSQVYIEPYKEFVEELVFSNEFPYELTLDQEKSISDILKDLSSSIPMDRLLCGDVGYGKTEVAFRAMFRTILNNGQVAYLCPTTILSKQQYQSAIERFKSFPVRIELLNRYIPPLKVKKIFADLKEGKIDIVIGTHKLLNSSIQYKNLGLLVIDEEQRFGVTHKEKIKEIKNNINVLTLSATPIPRTLKMAMSGLRQLSILDTPPVNRYPVQTYVIEENDLIIREAIYKELSRDGQIFVLINQIEQIESVVKKLNKLVPDAKISIGHGKMNSETLNKVMDKFVNKEFDILVCTTIIETGIDIPNANTIIIIDSDKFGLSQLYQIRGRVGRSDKIAYAYLLYKPMKILTELAQKRLDTIKNFTELGSGYKIAMKDLAIRGAGDLLGSEQAGFISSVGIDLYTKIVNQEINKLQNKTIPDQAEENNNMLFNVSTHINDTYVSDESIKIEIHKLINSIQSFEDYYKIRAEIEDRFGKFDETIEIYLLEKCTEVMFDKLKIKTENIFNNIVLILPENISANTKIEKLYLIISNINRNFRIEYKNKRINILLPIYNQEKHYLYYLFELMQVLYKTMYK